VSDKDASAPEKGRKIPPKKDPELDGLMSEIESDLREDELKRIWNRYGNGFIVVAVIFVAGVAAYEGWRAYATRSHTEIASTYDAAVQAAAESNYEAAQKHLAEIAAKSDRPYTALARLTEAGLHLQNNNADSAIASYAALAADQTADPMFRDLAVVLKILNSLDRGDAKALESEVAPLRENSVFRYSAIELSALLAAKQGDAARAAQFAQSLVDDAAAPQALRGRAQDLANLYRTGTLPVAMPPPAVSAPQAVPSVTDLVAPAAEADADAKPVPVRPAPAAKP